jgi:hypothetical protein
VGVGDRQRRRRIEPAHADHQIPRTNKHTTEYRRPARPRSVLDKHRASGDQLIENDVINAAARVVHTLRFSDTADRLEAGPLQFAFGKCARLLVVAFSRRFSDTAERLEAGPLQFAFGKRARLLVVAFNRRFSDTADRLKAGPLQFGFAKHAWFQASSPDLFGAPTLHIRRGPGAREIVLSRQDCRASLHAGKGLCRREPRP